MRIITTLLAACFGLALTACDSKQPITLGDPILMELPGGMATGPRLSKGHDGQLALSWMTTGDGDPTLSFATIENGLLTDPRDVIADARMFVNWADLPSVLHVEGKHWLAHWLRYSADKTYSYDVVVSQSFDDGSTWSDPVTAHDDGTPTEHGFVSMYRAPGGVSLLWLDGRNTPEAPMTLRSGTITAAGDVVDEQVVDASVCDCCPTDIAVSSRGAVAAYRDRTVDEIRDIYISRHRDGKWQPGTRLHADNWNIAGCPVNGPKIVANGDDVAVAWFTAADNAPAVRVSLSTDGGATFGAPVEISAGRLSGYVGLTFVADDSLAVSWVSRNPSGGNTLQLGTVSMAGELGEVVSIADIAQLRVVPQLGFQDGQLFLIWTDQNGDVRELRGLMVPVG
jgi:hypothetical protein